MMSGTLLLGATGVASSAESPEVQAYLKLRKQHGITQATTTAALETLVGTMTIEVAGTLKGVITNGDSGFIYLETSDGSDVTVEAKTMPDWLRIGITQARLLVRAERKTESGSLHAVLLGAQPEEVVAKYDKAKIAPKGSTRPTISSEMRGPIGKSGSGSSRSTTTKLSSRGGSVSRPTKVPQNWSLGADEALPYYTGFIKNYNKRLSLAEAEEIAKGIIGFSIQYGVDARLIMAIVLCESGFNPTAVSRAGARGLGQLMPGTAKGLGVRDSFDTNDNLYGTVKLIRGHLDKYKQQTGGDEFESLILSLAAYNAGSGAVKRHGGVPPYRETQGYVQKVVRTYRALCGE